MKPDEIDIADKWVTIGDRKILFVKLNENILCSLQGLPPIEPNRLIWDVHPPKELHLDENYIRDYVQEYGPKIYFL